jgi:hypothetical protein
MSGNITRGWANSRVIAAKVCRLQLDRTSSTTLTNVPGCSHKLLGGMTYIIEAHITGTATANGGAKATVGGDGVLTATMFTLTATNRNNATTNAAATTTTLGTAVAGATAAMTDYILLGSIVVNVPGVANLQFAQNASHADTSSAYVGSYIKFTPVD